MRRRRHTLLAQVERLLPDPWSEIEFVRRLDAVRPRATRVTTAPFPPAVAGLSLPRDDHDLIVLRASLDPYRRCHTLMHEVCHLCQGHLERYPDAVGQMLAGCPFPPSIENECEQFAHAVLERLHLDVEHEQPELVNLAQILI